MEHLSALAKQVRSELSKVIIGQREVIDQLLLVLVCDGHAVIEGVPGLAKTLAVKSLARIFGLGFQRVQCTAYLMPTDITGKNVFNLKPAASPCTRVRCLPICCSSTKSTAPRPELKPRSSKRWKNVR